MLTPKLIPMEKMEQLEKASKDDRKAGLDAQVAARPRRTGSAATPRIAKPGEEGVVHSPKGMQSPSGPVPDEYATAEAVDTQEKREAMRRERMESKKQSPARAKRMSAQNRKSDEEYERAMGETVPQLAQKQRLDDAAVQLEKIFGFRDRKKKDPSKTEAQEQRAHGTWDTKWRERDADKKRVARQRAQVKEAPGKAAGAAKEGVGRAAGAAAGAAYGATGAAERGTKRAGSLVSRAFGAGKRKAQDVAGAPGRRQERKASERHQSNLRQQATAKRVSASEDRRDARQQSPSTVQQGRTGYTNGHDTALGGKQGERSAAIAPFKSPSKIQQTDAASGKAPQQPKPYTPAKPKWGESGFASGRGDWKAMEKAMVSLQKYLDDCGCD